MLNFCNALDAFLRTLVDESSSKFLDFANKNLWEETYVDDGFIEECQEFYHDKTMGRLKLFLDNRDESFKGKHVVNK